MSRSISLWILAVCAALAATVFVLPASAADVHFQKESLAAYEGELAHHEVHAVTFHPGASTGHLHISLNNGGHMTVAYRAAQQSDLVAKARAADARVKVATLAAPKATAAHHKLRYIAGGVLVVVIVVVLIVLLIGRRRALADGDQTGSSGESAAS
jgi:hypothetical protein